MSASRGAVVFAVLALAALGTVMIYSASAPTAERLLHDGDNTLIKHLFWLGLGLCAFAATANETPSAMPAAIRTFFAKPMSQSPPWELYQAAAYTAAPLTPHRSTKRANMYPTEITRSFANAIERCKARRHRELDDYGKR